MTDDQKVDGSIPQLVSSEEEFHNPSTNFWSWKKNVVGDPSAPQLYSERAIWGFSVVVSTIFSSILFSMNLKRLGKVRFIPWILLFGIVWTGIPMLAFPDSTTTSIVFLWHMLGGLLLVYGFWPPVIGKELKYRTRAIRIPLVVAVIVLAFFLLVNIVAMIYGGHS